MAQVNNQVLLAYYDMVQAEVNWVRNAEKYDEALLPQITFFNQYFGGGVDAVVFQTLRESKALAYSTFAVFRNASNKDYENSFQAYIGTQSDKFDEAVDGMNNLLNTLPQSAEGVENARSGILKKIASERITGNAILFNYINAGKLGLSSDARKKVYEKIPSMKFGDLSDFHQKEISHKPYTYCIVAGEGKLDMNKVKELGDVKVLTLKDIFGY